MKYSPAPELLKLPKLSPLSKTLWVNRTTETTEKAKRHHPYRNPSAISIRKEKDEPFPVLDPLLKDKIQNAYIGGFAIPINSLSPTKPKSISRKSVMDVWYEIYEETERKRAKENVDAVVFPFVNAQADGIIPQTPKRAPKTVRKAKKVSGNVAFKIEAEEASLFSDYE